MFKKGDFVCLRPVPELIGFNVFGKYRVVFADEQGFGLVGEDEELHTFRQNGCLFYKIFEGGIK